MAGAKGYKGRRGGPWGPAEWGAAGLGPGKEAGRNAEPLVSAPGITTTPHSSPGGGGGAAHLACGATFFSPKTRADPLGLGVGRAYTQAGFSLLVFFCWVFFFQKRVLKLPQNKPGP